MGLEGLGSKPARTPVAGPLGSLVKVKNRRPAFARVWDQLRRQKGTISAASRRIGGGAFPNSSRRVPAIACPVPFLSRTRSTQCCVEFSSLQQPQPCCWSPSLPTTPMLAVAEVAAIGAVAEPTAAALSQFEELGAALSQCAAGE